MAHTMDNLLVATDGITPPIWFGQVAYGMGSGRRPGRRTPFCHLQLRVAPA